MLKLPAELRQYIWGYVGPSTAYSVFILVASETTRLARSLHLFDSCNITLHQGSYLFTQMISIFGTE